MGTRRTILQRKGMQYLSKQFLVFHTSQAYATVHPATVQMQNRVGAVAHSICHVRNVLLVGAKNRVRFQALAPACLQAPPGHRVIGEVKVGIADCRLFNMLTQRTTKPSTPASM